MIDTPAWSRTKSRGLRMLPMLTSLTCIAGSMAACKESEIRFFIKTIANLCFGIFFPALWWLPVGPGDIIDLIPPAQPSAAQMSTVYPEGTLLSSETLAPLTAEEQAAYGVKAGEAPANGASCQGDSCDPEGCCKKLRELSDDDGCSAFSPKVDPVHGVSPREACRSWLAQMLKDHGCITVVTN